VGITFVAAGAGTPAGTTTTAGTAAVTPPLPTGTATGTDRVFVFQAASNTAGTTPTGWTAIFKDVQVGVTGTAPGAGVGRRFVSAYYRDRDTTWTMPAFSLVSATNNSNAVASATLRKGAGDTWNAPTASGPGHYAPGTAGTAYSATSPSWTVATGGYTFGVTALNDNVSSGTPGGSQTGGIVLGTRTERYDNGTATGNDVRLVVGDAPVTTGGTGTITRTATLSAASQGGTNWIQQTVTEPAPVTLPYSQDFTGTNGTLPTGWTRAGYGSGTTAIQSNALQLAQAAEAWRGAMAKFGALPQDYELNFTWTFNGTNDQYPSINIRVPSSATALDWSSRMNDGFYFQTYAPGPGIEYAHMAAGAKVDIQGAANVPAMAADTPHRVRLIIEGTRVRYKTWPASGSEPADWLVDYTGVTATGDQLAFGTTGATASTILTVDDVAITVPSTGAAVQSSASSAAGASDTHSRTLDANRTQTSAAGASDSALRTLEANRTATSAAGASDSATWTMSRQLDASASDSAGASDAHSWTADVVRPVTDSAGATDSANRTLDANRTQSSAAGASDAHSRTLDAQRTATSAAGATDEHSRTLDAVRSVSSSAGASDSATWSMTTGDRYIDWEGHNWWVRTGGPANPGPNLWGNGTENVEVLPNGDLQLTYTQVGGQWRAAEIDLNENGLGYGRYRWTYDIDTAGMDPEIVLGLYIYDNDPAAAPHQREIDVEVTRWGVAGEPSQFWYSLHPVREGGGAGGVEPHLRHRQHDHPATVGPYTSEFVWQPGQVYWRTVDGNGTVIGEHVATEGVQDEGQARASLNLWATTGTAGPSSGQPISATISSFEFTPDVTHALVKAEQFVEDFATPEGWALYNGAEITAGEVELPCVPAYSVAYSGGVLDLRESFTQIEITSQPLGAGNYSQEALWSLRHDDDNYLMLFASGGGVAARVRAGGASTPVGGAGQDPVAQRFWRIEHTGTTVTFRTSPDGQTWSTLGSAPQGLTSQQLSSLRMRIESGHWTTEATQPAPFRVTQVGAVAVAGQRTATSSAEVSDTASRILEANRGAADTAGATDAASWSMDATRAASSAAGASDSASASLAAQRSPSDSAGATDSVDRTLDAQRSPVSTAGAVDSVTVAIDYVRTASSGAGATDTASASLAAVRSATSGAGAVDAAGAAQDYGRSAASAAGVTDSASWTANLVRSVTSTADVRDEVTIQAAGQTNASATSAAGATDTVTVVRDVVRYASSSAGAVDSVSAVRDVHRSASSGAGAVDAASTSAAAGMERSAVSTAGATDAATTQLDSVRAVISTAGATDSVTWEMSRVITRHATSGAGAVDQVTAVRDVVREASSHSGAIDDAATGRGAFLLAVSVAGATDSHSWTITTFRGAYVVQYGEPRTASTGRDGPMRRPRIRGADIRSSTTDGTLRHGSTRERE
jgi:hypothetical protein